MSRKQKRTRDIVRDPAQYGPLLARRFRLLTSSGAAYDAGDEDQTVVLASILRLLLADRFIDRVTSMRAMRFTGTATHPTDENAIGGYGFGITALRLYLNEDGRSSGRIVAPLGSEVADGVNPLRTSNFHEWWERDLAIYPTAGPRLTRKFVVTEMANTDGIHIDPTLDGRYDSLTRDDHGFMVDGLPVSGNVAHAAVRQIAWETQHSLQEALPSLVGTDLPMSAPKAPGATQFIRVVPVRKIGPPRPPGAWAKPSITIPWD